MKLIKKLNNKKKYRFDDFTDAKYRQYLKVAKSKFEFISYGMAEKAGNTCLWRHDVDTSPHRALKLAIIEHEESVQANYFIHLHSERYNAIEGETVEIFNKIADLGHNLGLHFDPLFFKEQIKTSKDLEKYLIFEKNILDQIINIKISTFSFHNPSLYDFDYSADALGGLTNAYGKTIREKFEYISDSFCIWRYRTLDDVLSDDSIKNLHVLLHPACWSKKPKSPYRRFLHTIDGRRKKVHDMYIDFRDKHDLEVIR